LNIDDLYLKLKKEIYLPLELGDHVFGDNFYQQYFFDKYSLVIQVRMS